MTIAELLSDAFSGDDTVKLLDSVVATERYGKTTLGTNMVLDGGFRIYDSAAIAKILKLANQLKFNVYPVSSNNNWGYGSFITEDIRLNYILDLAELNKITSTSKELGLITLEPGVTQQQLFEYLRKYNWQYMVPVTGAGPSCSIVGNALERGYGITPHNDHFYACTALKAYLPHPELCNVKYESAISAIDQSTNDFIDKSYKWGLGPYIDGLFTQSNYAVVSEMTFRLAPLPSHFSSFYIQIFNESKFEESVAFISKLLKDYAGIVASINLMDVRRLVSITADNPNEIGKATLMSQEQIASIAKQKELPQWMIVGSIYGEHNIVAVTKKDLKKRASRLGKLFFSDSTLLAIASKILAVLPFKNNSLTSIHSKLKSLQESTDVMIGIPNQVALPLPYWRNPRVRPDKTKNLSPAKDGCGLLWYAPLIKMEPKTLKEFTAFVRETTPKYNIEPLITFTNLKHDCVDSTVPLVFNLHNQDEVNNAHACLNELIHEGAKLGFVPYRLDISQQQKLNPEHIFWETTDKIKTTLDPNRILAPGRYNPRKKNHL
jgi:4-cresol dehydrogenase (hydroxylating)